LNDQQRILIIASEFPPNVGGIGNHACHLAKSLAASGFQVRVVADLMHVTSQELVAFKRTLPFKFTATLRSGNLLFTYISRTRTALSAAADADFIICSGKFPLWMVHLLRLRYRHKKIVAIVHGSELDLKTSYAKNLVQKALEKVNVIISVSSYTRQYISKKALSKVPCYIIHNGINIEEFESLPLINKMQHKLRLITIGSMTERKGQANVIKAMPVILNAFPGAEYHIIGKPFEKLQLQQLAQQLSVSASVIFHDEQKRENMLRLLNESSIKIMLSNHTSTGDFEGFGIALLEANALHKPVIGSNFTGIVDAVKDHETGRLVNPYKADDIAQAIKEILANYQDYSESAFEWAKAHDWKQIVQQYIEVLNAV